MFLSLHLRFTSNLLIEFNLYGASVHDVIYITRYFFIFDARFKSIVSPTPCFLHLLQINDKYKYMTFLD